MEPHEWCCVYLLQEIHSLSLVQGAVIVLLTAQDGLADREHAFIRPACLLKDHVRKQAGSSPVPILEGMDRNQAEMRQRRNNRTRIRFLLNPLLDIVDEAS